MTDTNNIVDDLYATAQAAKAPAGETETAATTAPVPAAPPAPAGSVATPQDGEAPKERRTWSDSRKRAVISELAKLKGVHGAIGQRCKELGIAQSTVSLWRRQLAEGRGGPKRAERATAARSSKSSANGKAPTSRELLATIDRRVLLTMRRALAAYNLD